MQKRTPEHREWVNAVFKTILFLSVNGIPFRGYVESTNFRSDSVEGGIFLSIFNDLLFRRYPELKEISKQIPLNAKYTSLTIQNEVIDMLYKIMKGMAANGVKKSGLFTVMMDGTTEKQRHELIGTVAQYFDSDTNKVAEHILGIEDAKDDKSAIGLLEILQWTLDESGISLEGVVSQIYNWPLICQGVMLGFKSCLVSYVVGVYHIFNVTVID